MRRQKEEGFDRTRYLTYKTIGGHPTTTIWPSHGATGNDDNGACETAQAGGSLYRVSKAEGQV